MGFFVLFSGCLKVMFPVLAFASFDNYLPSVTRNCINSVFNGIDSIGIFIERTLPSIMVPYL